MKKNHKNNKNTLESFVNALGGEHYGADLMSLLVSELPDSLIISSPALWASQNPQGDKQR